MPIRRAVFDWNGTVIRDPTEGKLWQYVGTQELGQSITHGNLSRTYRLGKAFMKLMGLTAAYKRGEIGFDRIYDVFNDAVLSDTPIGRVYEHLDVYAKKPETREKLDVRILMPLRDMTQAVHSSILSTGCAEGIKRAINELGKSSARTTGFEAYPFRSVVANHILPEGEGCRFDLGMANGDGKARRLRAVLERDQPEMSGFLYMGDSADDEACMGYVRDMGGHVAASLFASEDFKQHVAREYNGHVPEDMVDFSRLLKKS